MVAVMADEQADFTVGDQRDVAVRAGPVVPAGPAGKPGCEASTVDQHDGLLAARLDAAEGGHRARMNRTATRVSLPHVDELHRRQLAAVDACR